MDIRILLSLAVLAIIIVAVLFLRSNHGKPSAENAAVSTDMKAVTNQAADDNTKSAEGAKHIVADHSCIKLDQIPLEWIEKAKTDLHIVYGHTSHGSQITGGLRELTKFRGSPFSYEKNLTDGFLDLRDNPFERTIDLGQPDNKTWAAETRKYLEKNKDINVVLWSWCGQLSNAGKGYVKNYLSLMQELETEYPEVTFIYMTGHLDGTGENGTLARNNKLIREFCISNNKVLYDFADIESYNPDGLYFGDKYANDACDYDSDGDKKTDSNWATQWQSTHIEGVDWYACPAAHSQPVNANMKAYAAWWLMARLAGWDGIAPLGYAVIGSAGAENKDQAVVNVNG